MEKALSVYVALLEEGVDVGRPVAAWHVRGNVVRCETRRFPDGTSGVVATDRAHHGG